MIVLPDGIVTLLCTFRGEPRRRANTGTGGVSRRDSLMQRSRCFRWVRDEVVMVFWVVNIESISSRHLVWWWVWTDKWRSVN